MNNKIELSGIFSEGYGFVPKKLMKSKNLNSNTKLVLCYLLSYTGAGINCFPQIKDIANDLNISNRTVIRCIKQAINEGFLKKHQENRGYDIGKRNIYELVFMYDFGKNKSDKKSLANRASDTDSMASDNNDKGLVTPEHSNINSINNNNNNNKDIIVKLYFNLLKNNNITYKPNKHEYPCFYKKQSEYINDGIEYKEITAWMTVWFSAKLGEWCGYKLANFWGDIGKIQTHMNSKEYKQTQAIEAANERARQRKREYNAN